MGAGAAAGAGLGAEGAVGAERLKAEFNGGDATGWLCTAGAGAGAPIDRSKRSSRPEEGAAGLGAAALGDVNDEKSPNPLVLGLRFCG